MSKEGSPDLQRLTDFQRENYHTFSFKNYTIEGIIYPSGIGHVNDYVVRSGEGFVRHMDTMDASLKNQIGTIIDLAKLTDSEPQQVIDKYGGIFASVDFASVVSYSEGYAQAKGNEALKAADISALIISYAGSVKNGNPANVVNEIVIGGDYTRNLPRGLRGLHGRAVDELITEVISRADEEGISIAQAASLIINNPKEAELVQQDVEVSERLYPNQGVSQTLGGGIGARRRRSVVNADDLKNSTPTSSMSVGLSSWRTMEDLTMAGVEAEDSAGLDTISENAELAASNRAGSVSSSSEPGDGGYGTRTPSPSGVSDLTDGGRPKAGTRLRGDPGARVLQLQQDGKSGVIVTEV